MLSLNKLSVSVAGLRLCEDLSLTLSLGMCVGILGLNGSGKTSLIHTVAGFSKPDAGDILLDGMSIYEINPKTRAQKIACLLQNQEFNFPFSVFDMASLATYSRRSRFELLAGDDLQSINNALEITGLDDKKKQDVRSLSGGEKQRLAFTCLLVQNPDICLLDEPSNNLDLSYLSLIENIAKDKNKASIMVLHDLQLTDKICTHVLLLKSGEFLFGTKQETLNPENLEWVYGVKFEEILVAKRRFFVT